MACVCNIPLSKWSANEWWSLSTLSANIVQYRRWFPNSQMWSIDRTRVKHAADGALKWVSIEWEAFIYVGLKRDFFSAPNFTKGTQLKDISKFGDEDNGHEKSSVLMKEIYGMFDIYESAETNWRFCGTRVHHHRARNDFWDTSL